MASRSMGSAVTKSIAAIYSCARRWRLRQSEREHCVALCVCERVAVVYELRFAPLRQRV